MYFYHIFVWFLLWVVSTVAASISLPIVEEEVRPALEGRICAYGDIDKDHYMDLIVQRNKVLVILSQSEQGTFAETDKFGRPGLGDVGNVFCSVGDFDGNSGLDILVSYVDGAWQAQIFLFSGSNFNQHELLTDDGGLTISERFYDQPTVMDVNGDGASDVVGFVYDEANQQYRLYCLAGDRGGYTKFRSCRALFSNYDSKAQPLLGFPPIFADMDGDLGAEIVFAFITPEKRRRIEVWKMYSDEYKWTRNSSLSKDFPDNINYFGGPVVADFNADAKLDILIPICGEAECQTLINFAVLSNSVWTIFQIDMQDYKMVPDEGSNTLLRVGEFSLDGFPDLIATLYKDDGKPIPVVLNNAAYAEKSTFDRRFELSTKAPMILPNEISNGDVKLSSFFDLKEDGTLDVLVEYRFTDPKTKLVHTKIDFIKCDDKGDTTFLKVQIFTNVCTKECSVQPTRSNDLGSGIAWHGACVSFTMTDSWGGSKISTQCQIPQASHRTLYSAFALFGLGRSPNFVDEVYMGSPRLVKHEDQHSVLKQIVPNSRIIVVPPLYNTTDTHWQSRLYLTPSRLIIQSVLVLTSVCGILLLLVVFLHYRERRQDLKERQAQTQRFHFDAM